MALEALAPDQQVADLVDNGVACSSQGHSRRAKIAAADGHSGAAMVASVVRGSLRSWQKQQRMDTPPVHCWSSFHRLSKLHDVALWFTGRR